MPLLSAQLSAVVLIDFQERLMPAIDDNAAVLREAKRLLDVATTLDVPVVATRQYPKGLGGTVPGLDVVTTVVDKTAFGACAAGLLDHLPPGATDIVVAGCEAHVCLLQTAIELLDAGRRVWVVADACGSRTALSHRMAMDRLARSGAEIVTVEMVAFEWVRDAAAETFKAVSRLVR